MRLVEENFGQNCWLQLSKETKLFRTEIKWRGEGSVQGNVSNENVEPCGQINTSYQNHFYKFKTIKLITFYKVKSKTSFSCSVVVNMLHTN